MNFPYNEKRKGTFGPIYGRIEWGASIPLTMQMIEQLLNFPTDLRIERIDYNEVRNIITFIVKPLTNEAAMMFCHETPEACEYPAVDWQTIAMFAEAKKEYPEGRWSCQDLATKTAVKTLKAELSEKADPCSK